MNIPQGPWYVDDLLTFTVTTHRFDTGALTDADSVPSYRVYEDETGTAILTGSMAKLDDTNTTGFYSEQLTLSAANGFEAGKSYNVYVTAAVNSVTGGQSGGFKVSGNHPANVILIEGSDATNQIRDSIVDDATRIDASALNTLSSHDPGEAIMGATDLGTGAGLTSLASAANLATVAGYLDTEIAAILADTNELQTDWANGGRLDLILDARASQASVDDLPTNTELDTALDAADDAVLAILGAPTNGSVSADIDNLLTVVLTRATPGDQMALPAGEQNAIADALLDRANAVETGLTPRGALRLATSALAGKASGGGTGTNTFRNVGDTKDRITSTVDSSGNRTAVTTDAT